MATEREEDRHEGGGRGGKFQKRPPRRPLATPYDRPPTALRTNSDGKGWLSKIVDPAQKLIASSAHRLFSSVFRKRLTAPPLSPPPPPLSVSREANDETRNENQEEVAADPPGILEEKNLNFFPGIKSDDTHGVTDLEQILKEKTFTKFEIDRLTELLKSRVADAPSGVEGRKFEQVSSTPVISYGIHERSPKFPPQDGVSSHMAPSHVMSASVLDEDVASPSEIAKVYMGGRPPKATPLSMASSSQKFGDTSKSSTLSLVPRSPGNFDVIENGFVTPRSRGRSALYSMARTPYSRVSATPSIKNSVATIDAYSRATGSSPSQSALEQRRLLGSNQGALKRRSSVLDDEIGSVGSIRRIRQKSDLLYPKGLSTPSSFTSIPASGIGSETARHFLSSKVHPFSSSAGKTLHSGDTKRSLSKVSADSEHDLNPSSSFPQVSLRSSEMASKILEQLETLTPPKEKSSELKLLSVRSNSPMKLSPSMLHGPALRSLEDVDSSKYLKNVEDIRSNDARDHTTIDNGKIEERTSLKFKVPNDKSISTAGDGASSSGVMKDAVPNSGLQVSFAGSSSRTKCSFQMSALEDFEDMDEEGYSNGPVTDISFERREKLDGSSVAVSKPSDTEAITVVDKPRASVEVKPSTVSEMKKINDQRKSDVLVTTEKSTFSFATASSPSITANAIVPESISRPEITVSSEVPKTATAPLFGFGSKLQSQTESLSSAATFTFGSKAANLSNEQNAFPVVASESNVASTQQTSVSSTFTFGDKATVSIPVNSATENGIKNAGVPFKFASPSINVKESARVDSASVLKAETSSSSIPSFGVSKEFMSGIKAGDKSSSAGLAVDTSGNLFSSVSTSTPTPSLFSFSSPSTNSNLNNGSLVPTPSIVSPPATSFSNDISNQNSSIKLSLTAAPNNSEPAATAGLSTSSPIPSFSAAPIFKFGSPSVPSTSTPALSAPSGVGSIETKTTQETTLGNLNDTPPSDTAAAKASSTGNSVFLFGAAASTDSNKQPVNSTFSPGNVSAFGAPVLPASSGAASSTQSTPVLPFSSSSTSFCLAGSTGLSSGSSLFGSSAPASNLFTSGTTFGLASSSSPANNSVSSGAGTSSSLSNLQSSSTPSFSTGFSSTPTGVLSFGLSPSSAASNSAPMVFGSSSTGAAPAPTFSFTSAASASQPAFGNSSSQPAFGNSSSLPAFGNSSSQPAFCNSSPQPAFGNSSSQPAFGNSSSQPAFGNSSPQPAFGNSSSQPAFGNSSSQPAFGNSSSQPAFGNSSSQPAFGTSSSQPAFGTSSSQPAFGTSSSQPAFGTSSSQPAFGTSSSQPAFGTSSSQPAFGTSSSQPAFGTSSSQLAFGTSSSQPSFGTSLSQPSFGTSPAFGNSSSQPAFGNSSSQPAFGNSLSQPAFGNSLSQPAFGNSNPGFTFGSTPLANNFQANMVDSMAEDSVQAVAPPTPMPTFGQQPLTSPPSSGFMFGSTAPSPPAASPFQFGNQQNVPTPQNPSAFQNSGSFNTASAGGSFSLGAGGGDKANRKFIKVKSSKSRRK